MTGFGFDPKSAVAHLRKADPALAEVISAVGPFAMQLKASRSLFGALAEAIVYQQLSNKAAATIYGRIEALYPRARLGFTPAHIQRTADEKLRGVGLSRAKVGFLRDLAEHVEDGELDLEHVAELPDEEVLDQLTQVKGLGPWTVDMFLIFHLGRPDVLPVGDQGIRRAVQIEYGLDELPDASELARIAEPWRPHRSLACLYLWRSLDSTPV
jgi:DNA-3-methyladenine glycosylase II